MGKIKLLERIYYALENWEDLSDDEQRRIMHAVKTEINRTTKAASSAALTG